MSEGIPYDKIQNLWIKKDEEIIKNPIRKPVDINRLPFIDYEIFDRDRLYRPMYGKIYVMIHVELERGCPYDCTYCEAPQIRKLYQKEGNIYFRRKTAEKAIGEMKYLKEIYKPDYINFNAESFLAMPLNELHEFSVLYKNEIGLPFWCQSRPETVTGEKIKLLKGMGCDCLQFGIEQGNEEFRKKILNRHYTNKQLIESLRIVEQHEITYTVNNIIGFPGETRELIFDTVELNRQINPRTINCYMFTTYKGTALYKYCIENGYLDKNTEVHQLLDGAKMNMGNITYEELKGLQRTFPLYVKMPKEEWGKIRLAENFDEAGNKIFEELRKIYYNKYF
jgi:radical SAM superfamily enzyme YgiQ (UPF0313 family)